MTSSSIKKLQAASTGLFTGLVSGKFHLILFTGGYLNYKEVFSLRFVCSDFYSLIASPTSLDSMPDWSRIVTFLCSVKTLNVEPGPLGYILHETVNGVSTERKVVQDTTRETASINPRTPPSFKTLPPYDQVVALIKFQKLCVSNVLRHFKSTYNPLGWMPDMMGWDDERKDP